MWRGTHFLVVAVFALLWLGGEASAYAADAPPPTVKLSGPSPYTVHLNSVKEDGFSVDFHLSVENDGPELAAADYTFALLPDRTYTSGQTPTLTVTPTVLKARTDTQVPMTLAVHETVTTTLTVVMTVSVNNILPSSQTLTLTRSPRSTNFISIAVTSGLVGLLVFCLLYVVVGHRSSGDNANIVWTPSAFTFSGSWVTSISAVLTAVATVFTTTGVLTSLVPGIDTSFFLGVAVVYAVVLSLAPLVYSALMSVPSGSTDGVAYGTRTAFRAAAAITAVAISGQLSTVGAVCWLSDLSGPVRCCFLGLLGVVAVVIVWYIMVSGDQLTELAKPPPPPPPGPPQPPGQPGQPVPPVLPVQQQQIMALVMPGLP